jgi:hypothetical protein
MDNEPILKVYESLVGLRETMAAAFVPKEAQLHFRTAKKALLGVRAIMDHAINKLDEVEQVTGHVSRTKIAIDD